MSFSPSFSDTRYLLAKDAARRAGSLIHDFKDRAPVLKDADSREMVTLADREAEEIIRSAIQEAFPQDTLLGEENGYHRGDSGFAWVIDPIDGTTNYTLGIPDCCVSIAVFEGLYPVYGVAFNPFTDALYHAGKGLGAWLGPRRLTARTTALSTQSVFGFSSRFLGAPPRHVLNILAFFDEYRNIGSAVLHLCYAAAGQLDGAFAHSTRLWDIAAGGLILEEAGGAIMDFSLRPLFPLSGALETYKTTPVPFVATGRCENATLLRPFFVD